MNRLIGRNIFQDGFVAYNRRHRLVSLRPLIVCPPQSKGAEIVSWIKAVNWGNGPRVQLRMLDLVPGPDAGSRAEKCVTGSQTG